MKNSASLFSCLLLAIAGGLIYTHRPVVASSNLQTRSDIPDSTVNLADKTTDKEEWKRFVKKEIPLEQLSTANQKRADRHRQIILEQKDQANREQQQAKDIAEGKNTEIRQREAELHQLSEKLYTGMSVDQIAILFGEASATWPVSTSFRPKERIPNSDQVLIFSPHPKGKFQHSMGDSFQYLEVWINTNSSKVTGWRWTTPMLRL